MGTRRSVRVVRRLTALSVVVVMVGCTSSEDPSPPDEESRPHASATSQPQARTDAADVTLDDEVVAAVTSAGIRVVAADGSTAHGAVAPASGLEVGVEELAGLVAQGRAGSGTLGATMDALFDIGVPVSAFLVGYARGADTPGALLVADLLEGQDLTEPALVVFPALVPMLFASDLARAAGDPEAVTLAPSAYLRGGLCSSVSAAITRGINAVFDALHVNHVDLPKTGIDLLDGILQGMADLVVDGVNIVVEAGRTLVLGAKKYLIDQVLAVVAKVAAIAAIVGNFVQYVRPVNLTVAFDPSQARKGEEPTGNPVTATLTASTDLGYGNLDWPPEFVDCAKEAGVDLPPLKPVGEHVRWELGGDPGLLRSLKPGTATLGEGGPGLATATWELVTGTEAPGLTGQQETDTATVTAYVERTKVRELLQTVVAMAGHWLAGPLPEFIRKPLEDAVGEAVGSLVKDLVKLTDLHTSRFIEISYHTEDKKKPKHRETWAGSWENPGYGSSGTFEMVVKRTPENMSGTLKVHGAECISAGHLIADVQGENVEFGLVSGGIATITFTGVIKGRQVAGSWTAGEACGGWTGPWEATITPAGGR